ncbi:MAG TPA: ABC transporter ATP-binding protein, partial [Bacillota bacterium]
MPKLEAHSLTVAYAAEPVIAGLDLVIPPARITALIGRNGCGKSTLLRALARLLKPRAGTVYLDQHSIFRLPTRQLARQLGILPQGPVAPAGMTVRELVAQGRYPHQRWLGGWSEADERAVSHALTRTGLAELADRPVDTLSGGQRQRAWIAMALAQDSEILLLDEPTTYLDLAHQVEVLDLLADMNAIEGRTIVMVLHDLNQACRYAHHLIALRDGRVLAQGAPHAIVTAELVEQVFDLRCTVIADPVTGTPLC